MRLAVLAGAGGSGGYVRYLRGIFGSGRTPSSWDVALIGSPSFMDELEPLDASIRRIVVTALGDGSRVKRALWYLVTYPELLRRLQPEAEFYPSGQLRVYGRSAMAVATCHNLLLFAPAEIERYPVERQRALRRWREQQRRSFAKAHGIIFQTEHARRIVLADVNTDAATKVIPHGLDSVLLRRESRDYSLGDRITALTVSSIHPYKNYEVVIRAIGVLRRELQQDIALRIVGGGEQHAILRLRATIEQEGLRSSISLVGALPYDSLQTEYRSADLFIFASSCETFGISLLEAMGQAMPIACSRETGLPQLLQSGGRYFDPSDVHSTANACRELLASENGRKILGENARRRAAGFRWEESAEMTFDFIQRLVSGKNGC